MLNKVLNQIAGTTGLDATGAANKAAGTTGLPLVGALNVLAGTVGLDFQGVCNRLAGTTGLAEVAALRVYAAGGGGPVTVNYDGGTAAQASWGTPLDGGTPALTGSVVDGGTAGA